MKIVTVLAVAALTAGLAGCVGAGVSVGGNGASVGVAYYDDAYGPYYGGYWGEDGYFYYYTDATRVKFVRDNDRHFRRDKSDRFRRIEVRDSRRDYREDRREYREDRQDVREDRQDTREERREERQENRQNNN